MYRIRFQSNIWELTMNGNYRYPIIEDGYVCQVRFLFWGFSFRPNRVRNA